MEKENLEKFWKDFDRHSESDRMSIILNSYLSLVVELSKRNEEIPPDLKARFNAWLNDISHRMEHDEEMMWMLSELKR